MSVIISSIPWLCVEKIARLAGLPTGRAQEEESYCAAMGEGRKLVRAWMPPISVCGVNSKTASVTSMAILANAARFWRERVANIIELTRSR
ncbi:hypothetical protein [Devosia sp. A449]